MKRIGLHHDWLMNYLQDPKAAAGYLREAADEGVLACSVALDTVREAQSPYRRLIRWWRTLRRPGKRW